MAAPTIRMAPADWLWILLLSVIWGGSFVFIELALAGFQPLGIVAIRLGLGAALLFAWLWATNRLPRFTRERCIAVCVMGLLSNAIPFFLLTWGQTGLGAGLASIFNATTPLFTILVAHLWSDDDKITPSRLIALATGLAGVVVLMGGESLRELGSSLPAQLAVLGAAIFYAISGVYGRRMFRMGLDPAAAAAGQFVAAFLLVAPLALALDRPWRLPLPDATAWGGVLALAILSTAIGYIIFYKVLARSGATNAMLVTFLSPVSAILLATAFLGERLNLTQAAGMTLIFAGLAVADGRLFARLAAYLRRSRLGT